MRRREVIAGLGAALCCSPRALAQATARVYRVGLLSTLAPIPNESEQGAAFISAMSRAGYVLGQNLILERRGAMGQVERLPALVQELIEARVDVLVVNGYRTAVAAKASGHPTVAAAGTGDAVLTGLVESFARPGGNITSRSSSGGRAENTIFYPRSQPTLWSEKWPCSWESAAIPPLARQRRRHR
jgi:putative tryptophan/tyrosine transport system substrate-binding protein